MKRGAVRFLGRFSGGLSGALLLAASAFSQESSLDEVVVTAEKRSESASTVGMSIAVLDSEALDRLQVKEMADLVKEVPGLNINTSVAGTPIYTLRGIGFNTPNLSSTSPVGIYVDQVAYAYPYMMSGGVFDVSQVEVLKGPQGTLYGRNTTGGLINFISNRPTDAPEAELTLGGGNYDSFTARGHVSGPITSTLKGRVAFQVDESFEGWQRSLTRDDTLGEVHKGAGRAILDWTPSSDISATFTFNYWLDHSDTQAPQVAYYIPETPQTGLSAAAIAPYLVRGAHNSVADWTPDRLQALPGVTRPPNEKDSRFYSGVMQLDYTGYAGVKLTSLTAYNHVNRNDTVNGDGTGYQIYTGQYLGRIGSFSEELRLAGEGERYNWIVGGYYSNDKIEENQIIYIGNFSTAALLRGLATSLNDPRYTAAQTGEGFQATNQLGNFDNNSISGFANGQFQLNDVLKATGGVRFTGDRSHFGGCAADFNGNSIPVWNTAVALIAGQYPTYNQQPGQCLTFATPGPGPAALVNGELDQNNVSWRVNLDYTPADRVLLYGAIARGYKSGAYPIIPANKQLQYDPARQEEVTSYEIGAKLDFGRARLALAQYYDEYLNKQVFGAVADPIFTSLARLVNIPRSRIYGTELSLDWRLTAGLTFHGAGSYVQTKVLDYTGYDQFGDLLNFAGTEFPDTPHWQLAGNLTYDRPLPNGMLAEAVLAGTYQSFSHGDFQNSRAYTIRGTLIPDDVYAIPSYSLANASLSLATADQRWKGMLWVKNLLDRDYWTSANYSLDVVTRFSGMPRTYGASVTYHF